MARSAVRRILDAAVDAGLSVRGRYRCGRAAFLGHGQTLIRDARMGELVKVVGRLRGGGEPLRAPLTAATCLWYRTVAKHVDFGYPFPPFDWLSKPIVEEESTTMFVDDDSGSVLVHAAGARFSLVDMRQGWYQDPPRSSGGDAARRFLERYAVSVDRSYGPGEARRRGQRAPDVMSREPYVMYRESVLRAGETVALLGRPFMEPDPAGSGIGSRTPPIRIVFGGVAGAIMISNEPGVF